MTDKPSDKLPLISIVTPSFNQGQFIRETIESVLNQDYPALEYWVIDGGSTDETISILQHYEDDSRFHWISEPDEGQAHAINKGLAKCTGDIFNWLGSDDLLESGALRNIASIWMQTQEPILIYGLARHINEHGEDLGYFPTQSPNMTSEQLLTLKNTFPQPATFSPREVITQLGGVNVSLHYAMDLDLWFRLVEHIPIVHTPNVLAQYRLHEDSKTIASPTKFAGEVESALEQAAQRGQIGTRQARGRALLYAGRIFLFREKSFATALGYLAKSIYHDPRLIPEVMKSLLKKATRTLLGESGWEKVREVYESRRLS